MVHIQKKRFFHQLCDTNDVESKHAQEKKVQCFGKGSVEDAMQTLNTIRRREEIEEEMAIYGGGNFSLSKPFSSWFNPSIRSWEKERQDVYIQKFLHWQPSIENLYNKPVNAGMKPNHRKRNRINSPPSVVVSRNSMESLPTPTTMPTLISTPSTTSSTYSALRPHMSSDLSSLDLRANKTAPFTKSNVPSTATSTTVSSPIPTPPTVSSSTHQPCSISSASRSLDPRINNDKTPFILFLRENVSKLVRSCKANCPVSILLTDRFVVNSPGEYSFYDKKAKTTTTKFGARYIHYQDKCLKNFDTANFYAPHENFRYEQMTIDPASKVMLEPDEVTFLAELGIK